MKKGFTLVELLAVIGIIGLIALIVFPAVSSSIKNSKEKLYEIQVSDLEAAAKKWATEYTNLLDTNHLNASYISIQSLKSGGYLEKNEIKNPIDKTNMNGCVEVSYQEEDNQYHYQYAEKTCDTYAEHGWIYTYQDDNWIKTEKEAITSAGEQIIQTYRASGLIKSEGQTTAGLYDEQTRYIFRGNFVDNYVKIEGMSESFRILSIDAKNNQMRLLLTTPIPNAWDTENGIVFENASVSTVQLDTYYKSTTSSIQKIINKVNTEAIWNTGTISTDSSYAVAKSLESGRTSYAKLGLITVSDYVGASLDQTCNTAILSGQCMNENYLYSIFKEKTTWTLNNNGTDIWVIDGIGVLQTASPSSIYYIYPVVEVKANVSIVSGDGTVSSPYIIH